MSQYIRLTQEICVDQFGIRTAEGTIHEVLERFNGGGVKFLRTKNNPEGDIVAYSIYVPWIPEHGDHVHTPKGIGRVLFHSPFEYMSIVMPSGLIREYKDTEITPVCELPPAPDLKKDIFVSNFGGVSVIICYNLPLLAIFTIEVNSCPKELEGDYIAMAKTKFKKWAIELLQERLRELERV